MTMFQLHKLYTVKPEVECKW